MKSITKKVSGLMVGTFVFALALVAPGIGSADAATYSYYNCPTGNSTVYTNYSNCTTTTPSKVNASDLQSMVNKISQQYKAAGSSNSCYSFDQVKNILSLYK